MNSAEYYEINRTDREQWRATQTQACMWCGQEGFPNGLETHEIVPRSRASRGWAHAANYLLLCGPCHTQHFASMPLAQQLAVKLFRDQTHFDLDVIYGILGQRPVTLGDIHEALQQLRLPKLRPKQYPRF